MTDPTPTAVRAALRSRPLDVIWPSAKVRADLGGGRLELEPAVFSPDDVGLFAAGDRVELVGTNFASPAAAGITALDARTVTLEPPLAARAGDFLNLLQLAPGI